MMFLLEEMRRPDSTPLQDSDAHCGVAPGYRSPGFNPTDEDAAELCRRHSDGIVGSLRVSRGARNVQE
jgi:hypothetical protein